MREEDQIVQLRRSRLQELIASYTSRAEFANKFDVADAYLYQLLTGRASFGEKAARKLETKIGLDRGYFDDITPSATAGALLYDVTLVGLPAIKLADKVLTYAAQKRISNAQVEAVASMLDAFAKSGIGD